MTKRAIVIVSAKDWETGSHHSAGWGMGDDEGYSSQDTGRQIIEIMNGDFGRLRMIAVCSFGDSEYDVKHRSTGGEKSIPCCELKQSVNPPVLRIVSFIFCHLLRNTYILSTRYKTLGTRPWNTSGTSKSLGCRPFFVPSVLQIFVVSSQTPCISTVL